MKRLSQTSSRIVLIVSPESSFTVTCGYVIADQSMTCSIVIAWPGRSVVPQRKPGENAISVSFTFMSASRMTWSTLPLKFPRR